MQNGYSVVAGALIDIMLTFDLDLVVSDYTPANAILDFQCISGNFSLRTVQMEQIISDKNLMYFCCTRYNNTQKEKKNTTGSVRDYTTADDIVVIDSLVELSCR